MAEIIRMPRMSDTMEEGNIVAWLKKVGDNIEAGDVLAEVETDKATMELESYQEGTLLHIGVKEGPIAVNGLIAILGKKGEDVSAILEAEKNAKKEVAEPDKKEEPKTASLADHAAKAQPTKIETKTISKPAPVSDDGRVKASPLARKMAAESRLDLTDINGSGDGGRITKKDIEIYLKTPRSVSPKKAKKEKLILGTPAGTTFGDVGLSQMRKVIARRLGESKFSAPHFYLTIEMEMTAAIAARKDINLVASTRVSFNDMIVKACALALQAHPAVNSSWMDTFIRYNEAINIGVAVAVEDGLLVPVINNADQKSLAAINKEVKQLAGKAKSKKLQPDEMQGNTFTISNLGMFGIEEFTAIINPPDACILAVGGIIQKPIVREGDIKVGHMMKVTLSCDHRVVDGATGAKFLNTVKQLMEHPTAIFYQE